MKTERSNHVSFRTYRRADGTKGARVDTPESVVPIKDRNELDHQLVHYARLAFAHTTPDNQIARRKYVELIRPALRYYCKKFGREVPDWLRNDDYYTKVMTPEERTRHFGTKPLRIGEFQKLRMIPGAESDEQESDDGAQ